MPQCLSEKTVSENLGYFYLTYHKPSHVTSLGRLRYHIGVPYILQSQWCIQVRQLDGSHFSSGRLPSNARAQSHLVEEDRFMPFEGHLGQVNKNRIDRKFEHGSPLSLFRLIIVTKSLHPVRQKIKLFFQKKQTWKSIAMFLNRFCFKLNQEILYFHLNMYISKMPE